MLEYIQNNTAVFVGVAFLVLVGVVIGILLYGVRKRNQNELE